MFAAYKPSSPYEKHLHHGFFPGLCKSQHISVVYIFIGVYLLPVAKSLYMG